MKIRDPLAGLWVFLPLAETLNFSRTATTLGVSRATVTAQIQELEQRLGVRLLQRTTRYVALTEAGFAYKNALAGILAQAKEAEHEAKFYQDERIGTIRLSVSPDLGQQYLATMIADYLVQNPGLNILMDLSLESVDLVEKGFDIAIRGTMELADSLVVRKLASCNLVLCASPDYLSNSREIANPGDLSGHACLHFLPLSWGQNWRFVRAADNEHCSVHFTPRLETNDSISLREAARAGAGITLLPEYVVRNELRIGSLVHLLPEWKSAALPIHAIYPANRHITAKIRHFVSFLAKALSVAFREDAKVNAA
ncbi:LysR family transcriptional regulator [Ochrobactrum soli]|uniref:Transcriptional regulator, LysR family n=1 Tax=Ochrobactrum soli TaxID=2448455 RepID=A0A2P9HE78_9HYPH|nr:LysR family transcriptional regulator [[Ochrobactrum] soli]SPL62416.1 Transcriptional regulator, LysR family [[Ochrobactrum] soli]